MDIVQNRRVRLREWLELKCDGSQARFVSMTGINQGELSGLLKTKSFGEKKARGLELQAGMPKMFLDSTNASEIGIESASQLDNNISAGPSVSGNVPVISWVQAGDWQAVVDNCQPGEAEEFVTATIQIKRHTYALRVKGDSMSPDFREGDILIVEPEMDPAPGDLVIVKNGDNEATFKKLVQDGADWYLKPLNPLYPMKQLNETMRIVGVVRQRVSKFR